MNTFRTTFSIFLFLLLGTAAIAQPPLNFNYQAVIRNESGQVLPSEAVTIKIAILKGTAQGTEVFSEIHNTQTNEFGLVNLKVGSVNSLSGIQWGGNDYFIEISVNNVIMGTSQLLSVPFALHSLTSADAFSGDYNDLTNTPDLTPFVSVENPQNGDLLVYTTQGWTRIPLGQEGQALSISGGLPQWVNIYDNGNGNQPETVTDVDGNVYHVISIGQQDWLSSNLKTTRYADGTPIPTLSDSDWGIATQGAYGIYKHFEVDGIDSDEEMLEAYGALYNWFAVADSRGLCPAGWRIPTKNDWEAMRDYIITNYEGVTSSNVSNTLKSCRQIDSPLGGECDTSEHPRWGAHTTHFGTDIFGFGGLPGGYRFPEGPYGFISNFGVWWTLTEDTGWPHLAWRVDFGRQQGMFNVIRSNKVYGNSVRCIRN
jgi:uncharacterized protein (TIGR02145 family)